MSDKPKLETVATLAGVSKATVSQVLRGAGRISQSTRQKVLDAAKELRYLPDMRAASMRSGKNREIGLVVNLIANPFNAEVISGVSDQMEKENYLTSVLDARDDLDRQGRHLEAFIRNGRGGLLWVPAMNTANETINLLATHKIPTVTFLRRQKTDKFDHVGIRNSEAIRTAVNHLADLGHRRIAYLGGISMNIVRSERIEGYKQIILERSMGEPVIWNSPDSKLEGMNATLELLKAHPEITGLVCNGDVVALGACLALIRSGMQPGREVSVVGFDDIPDALVATPPLTTMAVSPYQLGGRLARALLDRIHHPEMPITIFEVSATLVDRGTTGPPVK